MLILEVMLIVIGLAAVVFSYKMMDDSKIPQDQMMKEAEIDIERVSSYNIDEIESQIEQIQEEATLKAADELSRISNEKLMGMDEYSTEVLNKISKNHEEVVFLYNMLNEKSDELKNLIHHVDTVKAQLHEDVAKEYQKVSETIKEIEDKKKELEEKSSFDFNEDFEFENEEESKTKEDLNAIYEQEIEAIEQEEKKEQQYFPQKTQEPVKQSQNHNNEIIRLYKKGHSVLEISRMLSLGQGEVKFVIDLFEAK